jgi:hypothetical protein
MKTIDETNSNPFDPTEHFKVYTVDERGLTETEIRLEELYQLNEENAQKEQELKVETDALIEKASKIVGKKGKKAKESKKPEPEFTIALKGERDKALVPDVKTGKAIEKSLREIAKLHQLLEDLGGAEIRAKVGGVRVGIQGLGDKNYTVYLAPNDIPTSKRNIELAKIRAYDALGVAAENRRPKYIRETYGEHLLPDARAIRYWEELAENPPTPIQPDKVDA